MSSIDYDHGTTENSNLFKNDDHLTAFGLALMQNGFATHGAILNGHTFQQMNKNQQQQQQHQHQPPHNHSQHTSSLLPIGNISTNLNSNGTNTTNGLNSLSNNSTVGNGNNGMHSNEAIDQKWLPHQSCDDINSWQTNSSKTINYPNPQKLFK